MTLDDELYCKRVESEAASHLIRCSIDDNTLAVQSLGKAFAGALCLIIKRLNGCKLLISPIFSNKEDLLSDKIFFI